MPTLGFRVQGFGCRVFVTNSDFRHRFCNNFTVQGLGFRALNLGFLKQIQSLGIEFATTLGFRALDLGDGTNSEFRHRFCNNFRVQGLGFFATTMLEVRIESIGGSGLQVHHFLRTFRWGHRQD